MLGLLISKNLPKILSYMSLFEGNNMGKHCKNCTCPMPTVDKKYPCEHCGTLCIKQSKRALCSLRCRLFGNVDKEGDCLLWKGKVSSDGYGSIMIKGKRLRVHRVCYEEHMGTIPSGLLVRHACDKKKCISPSHLKTGTVQDNSNDFEERAGHPKGENSPNARLKDGDILKIRNMYSQGLSQQSIADMFGITQVMVSCIVLRKSWSHI